MMNSHTHQAAMQIPALCLPEVAMVQNNSARRRRQWRTGLEKKQGGEEVLNQSDLMSGHYSQG
jgi:hypothetical protein